MTLPNHAKKIDADRQALAPYNFVPLPERVVTLTLKDLPDQDRYHPTRFSGYLECALGNASPLYVRAGVPAGQFAKYKGKGKIEPPEPFFHLENPDQPVIPGSSLRGMLRSLVEVASYSKVRPVTGTPLIYRAVGDVTSHGESYRKILMRDDGEQNREKYYTPLIRGGYIEKRGSDWFIRPAKEIGGATYAVIKIDEGFFKGLRTIPNCHNAREVYVEAGAYDYQPVRGGFLRIKFARVLRAAANPGEKLRRATLACSGWMNSKRNEAVVYEADDKASLLPLSDELVDLYREQISKEQIALLGPNGALNPGQPVFYVLREDRPGPEVLFFGHCRMFRIPYRQSPFDMLPSALRAEESLDLTEAIFGYTKGGGTNSGKARAYAGRVFFSDAMALPNQSNLWLADQKTVFPKIMASPKPTTFQHYLVQTQPNRFEIGRTRDGKPKYEIRLADFATNSRETSLRGHKFYWHKGQVGLDDLREDPKNLLPKEKQGQTKEDSQHTRIQPLRPGVQFHFRIDFENLSKIELGALLWALQVASDERYRLSLGMGKPLGMGAVAVKGKLCLIDRDERYQQLFASQAWAQGEKMDDRLAQESVAEFERFVLQGIGEKAALRLEEVERIRALLTLLSWPGPDPTLTRYMEIEHEDPSAKRGKRNEYRDRPVLPTPFGVWGKGMTAPMQNTPALALKPAASARGELPPGYKRGVVKSFGLGPSQSFGFITPEGGGQDIFVHIKNLSPSLRMLESGMRVIFKPEKGMKGPQAVDVRLDQ